MSPITFSNEWGSEILMEEALSEELEVMGYVAHGMKDAAIANRLGVSIVTVRRRVRRFRERVGANTRTQAVAVAASRGLLTVTDGSDPGN